MKPNPNERYLTVESPTTKALVDFLSQGVGVHVEVDGGVLRINVKASHGENASTWDEHYFEVVLPTKVSP